MNPFFITGLPRSRTVWLANLFTQGGNFCHHDALLHGLAALPEMLQRPRHEAAAWRVGDCDSALPLFAEQVIDLFPNAPWLIIRRDSEDARRDAVAAFGQTPYPGTPPLTEEASRQTWPVLEAALARLPDILPRAQIKSLDFEAIDDESAMREAWQFLTPEEPFNRPRYAMLRAFRMTIMPEKTKPNLAALAA